MVAFDAFDGGSNIDSVSTDQFHTGVNDERALFRSSYSLLSVAQVTHSEAGTTSQSTQLTLCM